MGLKSLKVLEQWFGYPILRSWSVADTRFLHMTRGLEVPMEGLKVLKKEQFLSKKSKNFLARFLHDKRARNSG